MPNKNRGDRYIFVGGAPRSGTTLVQNMLDSHPDICGIPEFKMNYFVLNLRKQLQTFIDNGQLNVICTKKELDNSITAFIESFLDPLLEKYKCKLLSEKTPNNIVVFEGLIELFPGAKFIHVVRDPRAVVSSLLQVEKKAKEMNIPAANLSGLRATIGFVQDHLKAGFDVTKKHPEKILTINYEKLVTNPESETKNICQFLGIEWFDAMLKPGQIKHLGEEALSSKIAPPWYDKKSYCRDPEKTEVDKWKILLTPAEQIRITKTFREWDQEENLHKLGYELSTEHLKTWERLKGQLIALLRVNFGDMRLFIRRIFWRFI